MIDILTLPLFNESDKNELKNVYLAISKGKAAALLSVRGNKQVASSLLRHPDITIRYAATKEAILLWKDVTKSRL